MSVLEKEEKNAVLWVSLNRPEVKNAMNAELIQELKSTFLGLDSKIRAVVLKSSSDFFCAGGDLKWMKSSLQKSEDENRADTLELARMFRAVDECDVPVICVLKGGAFGGGVGLVAASDIVICEDKAVLSLSEVKLGLIPATIGPLVMRKIGVSQARRLYLTGKRFSGAEAKAMGLVHEVGPVASLHSVVVDYLRELSQCGPEAVKTGKALIRELSQGSLWHPDVSEETSKLLSEVRIGKEAQEGMTAFFEKRQANWRESLTGA